MHQNKSHLIVLLHGINQNCSSLQGLERFLLHHNFSVLNRTYPSTKYLIEDLVDIVHEDIKDEAQKHDVISFVGFSMGGLILRAYLNKYKLPNLAKVIMIATPNKGSEVADFLKENKLYKKFFGPAGRQLTTNQKNHPTLFGETYYECGIIAGNLPLDFCYPIMRKNPNDGKVSVNSTKIYNMKDHIVIKATHWYMPKSRKVWKQVLHFLRYSKFNS